MTNIIQGKTQKTSSLTSVKRKLFIRQLGQQNLGPRKANAIPRKNGRVSAPLSLTQQRIWLQEQIEPERSINNVIRILHLRGNLNQAALESALIKITARHEVLRTIFAELDGEAMQHIVHHSEFRLITKNLGDIPQDQRQEEVKSIAQSEAQHSFDLSRDTLIRVVLLQLEQQEHVLIITLHHIVSDGWSTGVLYREMEIFYRSSLRNEPALVPDLPIQYADFAEWQRNWLQSDAVAPIVDFWKKELLDAPRLKLPFDRCYIKQPDHLTEMHSLQLSAELTGKIKQLGQNENCTLFMTLLACFNVLLHRYSGETDIVIGTPISGRHGLDEIKDLIGFFVNTLALRTDLSGNPSFRQLLGRVREMALRAYRHSTLPFDKLVEILRPDRVSHRNPLFDIMINIHEASWHEFRLDGLNIEEWKLAEPLSNLALSLSFMLDNDCMFLTLKYQPALLDEWRINLMLGHMKTLLEGCVANPDQSIAMLPLLTDAERRQLLVEWNNTAQDYPHNLCVHQLFEAQVESTPDSVAVVHQGQQLSYAELNERANQLARHLTVLGVGPEVLVGLFLERSLELVIGVLGILKAGGAYLPLDPGSPRKRLRLMLDDTRAPVILTKSGIKDRLPSGEEKVLSLDTEAHQWQDCAGTNLPQLATAADMAYVMYTSGSTGTPKGVMVTHRGIARLVCNNNYIQLDSTDAVAHVSNPAFDAVTFEIWGALVNGSRLTIIPGDIVLDPSRLADELRRGDVSTLFMTAALFNEVIRARPSAFAGLKQVLFGGEAADPHWVRECLHAGGPQRLLHVYGPTEATTFATWHPVATVAPGQRTIPIGRPIANTTAYVLDRHLQLVPVGVAGELHIGGDGLARGYWQRPELTAGHFVSHPFVAGERLYKTGDLVRYLPDGNLEFLGRLDTQVKLRGFRIELGEIESLLTQQQQVRAAVVLLREDMPGDKRLVAYVVAQAEPININELRAALNYHLPDYMIPADFVDLPALPLNLNGKIDRKALPAPIRGAKTVLSSPPLNLPSNPVEEAVAGVWCELLHLHQIGIHDNFFELGGHSLLAIQMLSRLRDLFVIELSLRTVFDVPTIAGLAGQISTALACKNENLTLQPITTQLPLSFAQQRLWFQERLAPEGAAYNIALAVRLEGELNVNALVAALNMTVARHDALRTTFGEYSDEPMQVIAPSLNLMLKFKDLSALPAVQLEAELQQRAQDAAQTRFDLERGPLLRATLLHLGERSQVLVLVMHHIVSDGWSVEVLLSELSVSYGALVRGELPSLPALPMQYADYALWQREVLKGETLGQQLEYWTRQLAGMPFLRLPTDRVPPAVQCLDGSRKHLRLSATLADELKRLSAREGVTLFMTLLAALQVLLARHTGQMDIPVGAPIAGRTRPETEGLIGFFVNTLVLRTDVSGNPSFRGLLHQVREICLGAYANQDLPFEKLVEALKPARDLSHHPLFDVMLNLLEGPENVLQLDGLKSQRIALDTSYAKFAITLYAEVQTGGINLNLVYQNALFSAEHMAQLLEQYHQLLEQIVEAPEYAILSYSLITPSLRARLPDPLAVIDSPEQVPVTRQFARWVDSQPEAIAISQGTQQWSYRLLADAAHRLAQSLADSGIGQGDVVAITGPSSFGLVSSMLGVWLCGGVFLTIDSLLPQARQHVIMREAGVRAICRIGASPLPEGPSGADAAVAVFEIDPARGIVGFASANTQMRTVPLHDPDGDAPAYIFFTSGSTGIPKGILGCHKGLSHFLGWQREAFEIGPHDRVAQLTNLSFDVLLRDIFLPLTSGGTLCIPENSNESEPLAWLERERVTVVHTVPTLLQSWLAQPSARAGLRALRWLFIAGEPLPATLVLAWRETFPGSAEVVNLYGTTETTLAKCFYRITDEIEPGAQPVGAALPQTQALVLNEAGTPCGVGETGQVVLRTPFRSLGYINATQEMRTCFARNPYRDDADDLFYFTGDRGRYRVDGTLDLLGRLDDQIKIRGVRVEPAEVTAVLGAHPAVKACVVVGRSNEHGENFLLAYVVPACSNKVSASELRAFLNSRLPAALVPTEWLFLDGLPRLPNGKVHRSALPVPAMPQIKCEIAYVAPSTPTESKLVDIWQGLLDVVRIGVNDNFFDMGGHSLKLMQLASRIRRVFGIDLPLIRLFDMPTVAELACELVRITKQLEETELERVLREIELLTDEETMHELNARSVDT